MCMQSHSNYGSSKMHELADPITVGIRRACILAPEDHAQDTNPKSLKKPVWFSWKLNVHIAKIAEGCFDLELVFRPCGPPPYSMSACPGAGFIVGMQASSHRSLDSTTPSTAKMLCCDHRVMFNCDRPRASNFSFLKEKVLYGAHHLSYQTHDADSLGTFRRQG